MRGPTTTKTPRLNLLVLLFLLPQWFQFHERFKSSKILNVLIMKRKFSQDSDRSAFFSHLKLVLPFVLFHFEVSSFLTYRCSAARPYLHVDSQARVSGATVLPAAVLPTIASETGALPPVWARRVCA